MSEPICLDLFPLHSVLFPYQDLSLRIFEPRYLKMISHCQQNKLLFGVCLIEEGSEVGAPAIPFSIGTSAVIQTYEQITSRFLIISVQGNRRFRIARLLQEQPHIRAEVEWLDEEAPPEFPGDYSQLRYTMVSLMDRLQLGGELKKLMEVPEGKAELLALASSILSGIPQEKQKILELSTEEVVPALTSLLNNC